MPAAILNALAWIFKKFSLGRLANFVLGKVILTKYVAIEIAMFLLMLIYFGALLRLVVFLFDNLYDIYVLVKNLTNPSGATGEVASVSLSVLSSLGFLKAFWDVFNLYAPFFISLFLVIGSGIGIKLLNKLRNSLFCLTGFLKL